MCHKQEKQMANAVRFLSAEMIEKAKSGHPRSFSICRDDRKGQIRPPRDAFGNC